MPQFQQLKEDKANFDKFKALEKEIDETQRNLQLYEFSVDLHIVDDAEGARQKFLQNKENFESRLAELRSQKQKLVDKIAQKLREQEDKEQSSHLDQKIRECRKEIGMQQAQIDSNEQHLKDLKQAQQKLKLALNQVTQQHDSQTSQLEKHTNQKDLQQQDLAKKTEELK